MTNVYDDFGFCISEYFPIDHNENISDAKFKIGQVVRYRGHVHKRRFGNSFTIIGVNQLSENEFEYSLKGFPYLVFQEELEELEDIENAAKRNLES